MRTQAGRARAASFTLGHPTAAWVSLAHTGLPKTQVWAQACVAAACLVSPGQSAAFRLQALVHTEHRALSTYSGLQRIAGRAAERGLPTGLAGGFCTFSPWSQTARFLSSDGSCLHFHFLSVSFLTSVRDAGVRYPVVQTLFRYALCDRVASLPLTFLVYKKQTTPGLVIRRGPASYHSAGVWSRG